MQFTEVKRLINLSAYEDELYGCGFEKIAGVDEVGRGSLAGPIVAAAVIFERKNLFIEGLNDSKKIPGLTREKLFRKIISGCRCWSVAKVSSGVIDRISLGNANILVIKKAISRLRMKPDIVITDAIDLKLEKLNIKVLPIINGDQLSASIAAASIIAKVIRDKLMIKLSRYYPEFGFHENKGYGTKKHILNLQKYGPCDVHRISFRNVLN